MATSVEQQLGIYLTDAHAIELQALAQVKRAQKVAGDPKIAAAFSDHVAETERHQRYVEARLQALSWAPVPQKDIAGRLSGVGMALFARFQRDTPGKLVAHACSYERMELAAYDFLARLADRTGDSETAVDARTIADEERAMAERLASLFDRAVDASLREHSPDDVDKLLNTYLADAHAIERQATKLLAKAREIVELEPLANAFDEHLEETRHHGELIEARLRSRGGSPSTIKDLVMRAGAVNLGVLFKAQVDVPVKLAAFAYAFEHLEVAGYELLGRVAARAGDEQTAATAGEILLQERAAAARIHGLFDQALDSSLEEAGVTAG